MTVSHYIKDKIISLLVNLLCLFVLNLYLLAVGNNLTSIFIITVLWILISTLFFTVNYQSRKRYFSGISELMERLDQPYLVQELMTHSWRLEDRLNQEILKVSNKAVIERIYLLEQEQKEYREFIDGWIHEVKLPITGIRLLSHNLPAEERRRIEGYLTELDNDVEQALFYARSDQVFQDYMIKETDLLQVIQNVLKRNKYLMIQNEMSAKIDCDEITVFTDAKWLEFILGQILINAVKYRKEEERSISFIAYSDYNRVRLLVRDCGIGIPDAEVAHVFEKGFTGSNGRKLGESTGIGLYLCRKLCLKLGLEIEAGSVEGEYTDIILLFPRHDFLAASSQNLNIQ